MAKTGDKKSRRYMMIQRVNMESQRGNVACITSDMSLKSISGPFNLFNPFNRTPYTKNKICSTPY